MRLVPDRWEDQVIISGIGISRVGRKTGIADLELTIEASKAAIADAGLTPGDIDGIASLGETPIASAATALEIDASWSGGLGSMGGLLSPVFGAGQAIAAGEARHVLVYRTVKMMGGSVAPSDAPPPMDGEQASDLQKVMGDISTLLTYHAYGAPLWLSMHARRHMELYGTTREQLGWLAINSRKNAALNERAVFQEPLAMDDYLSSRPISEPFHLLDCDVPIDGSIALVLSVAAHADATPNPAVRINAVGGAPGVKGGWWYREDYPNQASTDASAMLWSRSDLTAQDVDFAELYDGFTFLTFAWLEALGLCGQGEAGPFVEGAARIALDGQLPLNTYGGQLSAGRMHGYWVLHEACLQLQGQAGARQIPKRVETAVAAVGGGPIAGCMLLTT
jgi:acetyl-CoA acetyltransferase